MPYQIVIDTNVVVAAQRSKRGASNALLQQLNSPKLQVHVSNALLFEYEQVLRREQAALDLADSDIDDLLDGFCQMAVKHFFSFFWRASVRDADDDFLVDLAVAARADYLVTYNIADLRGAEQLGIKVVTAKEMLEILRARV